MIIDSILFVLKGILNILLSPLSVVNIGIDLVGSIPFVGQFLGIIVYVIPWDNIFPLILLTIVIINFKNGLALIRFLWGLLPFV